MNGKHVKYMLLGGAGAFGVMLLLGVPVSSALLFAVVLACPLMMLSMGGHQGHGSAGDDHAPRSSDEPEKYVNQPGRQQHHS